MNRTMRLTELIGGVVRAGMTRRPGGFRRSRFVLVAFLLGIVVNRAPAMLESTFLYFPTHSEAGTDLQEWRAGGNLIGYSSPVASPRMVWLMFHGNAGQASDRGYVRGSLRNTDALFIAEYPGYGRRKGSPSMHSINAAAVEAYGLLQTLYPGVLIGVIGESLGSGPASYLCSLPDAPSRAVLIVPFDNLLSVAKEHIHFLPVSLLMRDKWDNVAALARYAGRVDIYGAAQDTVIPVHHARQLAQALPRATYHEVDCGHNDWSSRGLVKIGD
jgi:pimeloyl-ACP methyl ester carboxylesterase